MFTVIYFK